ncbi:MAG: HlyD family type I secretion periplasmic adaptor subunit [Pseudomonadales bacterium]|jgi:epimerase transport system membrane fusion protein|nr:HlyD family type I secretion periplasmic adaptor subunit [Pseudomonadales bacterium]
MTPSNTPHSNTPRSNTSNPGASSPVVPSKRAAGAFLGAAKVAEGEVLLGDNLPPIEVGIATPRRIGLIIAFLVFGVFGGWAAFVPIEGASHAAGTVTVKSYKKLVQHLEGGIVKDILVQNGDEVAIGDILLVMDNTQPLAQLEIASTQLVSQSALEARLIAERDNLAAVVYSDFLTSGSANAQAEIASQNQVFTARKTAREGEKAVLQERIRQLQQQIVGMRAQHNSKTQLAKSFADELHDINTLLAEGFADKQHLREVERNHEQMQGDAAQLFANIAATELQVNETQMQILQSQNQFQTEVANQLAQTQTQLKDLHDRIGALSDVVARTEVKAPAAGTINNLQVHTIGGVISAGTPIAEIVPKADELVVEAHVSLADIDRVAVGQEATIRFSTFSRKTVPTFTGHVIGVSADSIRDQNNGVPFYLARLDLSPESLAKAQQEGLEFVPGMPAEVLINSGARTFLQYVMKPFSNVLARTFRED